MALLLTTVEFDDFPDDELAVFEDAPLETDVDEPDAAEFVEFDVFVELFEFVVVFVEVPEFVGGVVTGGSVILLYRRDDQM